MLYCLLLLLSLLNEIVPSVAVDGTEQTSKENTNIMPHFTSMATAGTSSISVGMYEDTRHTSSSVHGKMQHLSDQEKSTSSQENNGLEDASLTLAKNRYTWNTPRKYLSAILRAAMGADEERTQGGVEMQQRARRRLVLGVFDEVLDVVVILARRHQHALARLVE